MNRQRLKSAATLASGALDRAITALLLLGAAVALYLLVGPSGFVRVRYSDWRNQQRLVARARKLGSRLVSRGQRLDNGASEIWLIEFSDYECPFCRRSHPALKSFLAGHPGVGVVFRQMPLPTHAAARGAARAAMCAGEQGLFLAMHDHLFETSEWQTDTNWVREATGIGIRDSTAFWRCLRGEDVEKRISADLALARQIGLAGTPSFISNSEVWGGALGEGELAQRLRGPLGPPYR